MADPSSPAPARPRRERGSSFALHAEGDPRAGAWAAWEALLDARLIGPGAAAGDAPLPELNDGRPAGGPR